MRKVIVILLLERLEYSDGISRSVAIKERISASFDRTASSEMLSASSEPANSAAPPAMSNDALSAKLSDYFNTI